MYVLSASKNPATGAFVILTRALLSVPLHAVTGVLIGADIAEKRFGVHSKNYFQIIMKPFLLHGIYDFCAMFAAVRHLQLLLVDCF